MSTWFRGYVCQRLLNAGTQGRKVSGGHVGTAARFDPFNQCVFLRWNRGARAVGGAWIGLGSQCSLLSVFKFSAVMAEVLR